MKIEKRKDVNPSSGIEKYGDVKFADPVNHKYPIDTPEHIRAAARYIGVQKNADKYGKSANTLKNKIESAMRGIK